jgi:hypothetical protein
MTPEQRLDRLERIAKLLARAGLRAREAVRESVREQNSKINMLIDAQIGNEERFAKLAQSQDQLAQSHAQLAESQLHSDHRLDALIDIIREGRNGKSQ